MIELSVLKSQQSERLHDFRIELYLCFYIFRNDIDQGSVFGIDALLHICEIVHYPVDSVSVFAEHLEFVILIVAKTRADHTQEQIALFLLLDQFCQSALVCDAKIQIAVRDQDHLIISAFDILFFSDLISLYNTG